jgi:predicted kinase
MSIDALLITGGPGSGKSSVAGALGTLLEVEGVRYGAIETELLAWGWPWLTLEDSLPQLRSLVALQREAGRELFLIIATTETEAQLRGVLDAVQASRIHVVCLSAPAELAAQRVADREPDSWPGKAALVEHARQLADVIPALSGIDHVLSTRDRSAPQVAAELRELMFDRFGLRARA